VNWNNSEGEVSGDLGLRLFIIIDKMKKIGDTNTPPGITIIMRPIINGIHHFEFGVWADSLDSLLGIRGLVRSLG
jgi:hypothetical protein